MAGGDIPAGKAYVELGTDSSKLVAGLNRGLKRVRAFAAEAGAIGSRIVLFGSATTAGLIATAKTFADAGDEMARFRDQTGLSAEAISGLKRAAADNDVAFDTVRTSFTILQKNIANGGDKVEEAFGRIGSSIDRVRRMKPDDVLRLIADGLPEITDESERTATAVALLGRSGAEMLAIFKSGATSIREFRPFTDFGAALETLQRSLAAGGPEVEEALARIGLSLDDLRGRKVDDALALIVSRLRSVTSEADRAAAAVALFGNANLGASQPTARNDSAPGDEAGAAERGYRAFSKLPFVYSAVNASQDALAIGSVEVRAELGRIGLTVEQLRGLRPDQAFTVIAARIAKLKTETERARASLALFGSDGRDALEAVVGAAGKLRNLPSLAELGETFDAFQDQIASGGPKVEQALARLGIGLDEVRKRKSHEALALVADRLSTIKTRAERAALAMTLAGSAGAKVLPRLAEDREKQPQRPTAESVQSASNELQSAIANGGERTERALAVIGVSLEQLRGARADEALALVADGLANVESHADRTKAAISLLGQEGPGLVASLRGGSASLDAAAAAAARAGEAFDDKALDAAKRLDEAFDGLDGSVKGLRNSIGESLEPVLSPMIETVTRAVEKVGEWIKANPELAQSIFYVALATIGFGAALVVLATTGTVATTVMTGLAAATAALDVVLAVLTAPITLIALAVGAIIVAFLEWMALALAVTDVLGITSIGFGDLFNSIRVGGQGVATWIGKLWTYIVEGWEYVKFGVETAFDAIWGTVKSVATSIYGAFKKVFGPIVDVFTAIGSAVMSVFQPVLDWLVDAFEAVFGWIAGAVKDLVGWLGKAVSWVTGEAIQFIDDTERAQREKGGGTAPEPVFSERLKARREKLEASLKEQRERREKINAADPNDGSLFGFDGERAKKGFAKIGSSFTDLIKSALAKFASKASQGPKQGTPSAPGAADAAGNDGGTRSASQQLQDSLRALTSDLESFKRAIAVGGPSVEKALATLGLSIDQVRNMRPEDAFALLRARLDFQSKSFLTDFDKFKQAIAAGGPEIEASLAALNLSLADVRKMDPEKAFALVSARVDGKPDPLFTKGPDGADPEGLAREIEPGVEESKRSVDVFTTFNADIANRLGIGSTLEERKVRAAESTARNTKELLDEFRLNGSAAAVFGP